VNSFPQSDEAKRVVQKRWHDEHPRPIGPQPNEAYTRELLAATREWHKQWPDDLTFPEEIFTAVNNLPHSTAEQVAQAADDLLAIHRKGANAAARPMTPLLVAEAYFKHRIRMDEVPGLVRESAHHYAEHGIDDREDENTQDEIRSQLQGVHMRQLRILLDYYATTKRLDEIKAIEAELETIEITKSTPKAALLSMRAKAAEIEGRKIDALALYRCAIAARTVTPPAGNDKMLEKAKQMWRELGGSPELYAMLGDTPQPTEATDQRWQRPRKPLPAFSVADLQGNTWKLPSLEGKILLVNIWATWCAPCVEEHRELQKLYEKTKDHGDVVVLSFNVDKDLGKVVPYIAKHQYTFPVVLAKDLIDAVEPSMGLPRNWLVDTNGKLQWELVGYGPNQRWEAMVSAKIEEVRQGAQ
jgi:thiol-disulfide isomerase/thioredoxin